MPKTFEDFGLSATDVQPVITTQLNSQSHANQNRITFAGIISFLWCANTAIVGLSWNNIDELFITHGTSLEAEFDFFIFGDVQGSLTICVLRIVNVFLADLILIWRCWVSYGRDLRIVGAPSICLMTETISACFLLFYSVTTGVNVDASRVHWTILYYVMTVATNSLCTFLLLFRCTRASGVRSGLKTSRGIIEILVESAAMYAAIYIALLIAFAYEFYTHRQVFTAYYYPLMMSYSITGIAPTLIIARVMSGQSQPSGSWTRSSLPRMRSTLQSIAESIRFAAPSIHGTRMRPTTATNVDLEQTREALDDEGAGDVDTHEADSEASLSGEKLSEEKAWRLLGR
ncbi:hypothetical protein BDZ89DRAFT_1040827 [Hymenopellis radicata]|nr:hypothetical protein BDZ89DRAFT_1040827 [Hymenopellis radicata]